MYNCKTKQTVEIDLDEERYRKPLKILVAYVIVSMMKMQVVYKDILVYYQLHFVNGVTVVYMI